MVICIDIGNTNIKYAIYEGETLKFSFRVATDLKKTSDEYGAQLTAMLTTNGVSPHSIKGGIISSVVPTLDYTIDKIIEECGFSDRNTFYERFKNKYGCTPSEYRNT